MDKNLEDCAREWTYTVGKSGVIHQSHNPHSNITATIIQDNDGRYSHISYKVRTIDGQVLKEREIEVPIFYASTFADIFKRQFEKKYSNHVPYRNAYK
jgi:hypothetical protein